MVEEIETISAFLGDGTYTEYPKRFLRVTVKYTEHADGTISDLVAYPMTGPAIINGKPCVPGRRFTKKSFEKIMRAFEQNGR